MNVARPGATTTPGAVVARWTAFAGALGALGMAEVYWCTLTGTRPVARYDDGGGSHASCAVTGPDAQLFVWGVDRDDDAMPWPGSSGPAIEAAWDLAAGDRDTFGDADLTFGYLWDGTAWVALHKHPHMPPEVLKPLWSDEQAVLELCDWIEQFQDDQGPGLPPEAIRSLPGRATEWFRSVAAGTASTTALADLVGPDPVDVPGGGRAMEGFGALRRTVPR